MTGGAVEPAEVYTSLLEHFARYFDACDRADLDSVMDLLDGATVSVGDVVTDDPAAIRRAYEARQPAPAADGRRLTKHHVTNLVVEPGRADGELDASAYYFRLEPGESGPRVAVSGRLQQTVAPGDGRWRVRRHAILADL